MTDSERIQKLIDALDDITKSMVVMANMIAYMDIRLSVLEAMVQTDEGETIQ
jgi:hypothetical protein